MMVWVDVFLSENLFGDEKIIRLPKGILWCWGWWGVSISSNQLNHSVVCCYVAEFENTPCTPTRANAGAHLMAMEG
jgi:hypothetical protein